jgi:hypothetical protein
MSKEIKFKYIWSNPAKTNFITEIFTLDEIEAGHQFTVLENEPLLKDYKLIARVQFIGLLDASENPIFLGDILSSKEYYNNDLDANYKRVGEVKFNDGYNYFDVGYYLDGFEFKNGKVWRKFRNDLVKTKYDIDNYYNTKPISNGGYIIGNIYQNPELIGGENE